MCRSLRVAARPCGAVENKLWYLATLHASAVGALRRALKLKVHVAHAHLGHALLTKKAQLGAVQNDGRRVETVRFHLDRILEKHMERVARSVRIEMRPILREHPSHALQFNLHIVVRSAGRRTVQPKAHNKNTLVHGKLNRIAASAIAPLVAAICTRLEAMAHLRLETRSRSRDEPQVRLDGGRKVEKDVYRLVRGQNLQLRHAIGKLFECHRWDAYQVQRFAQHLAAVLRRRLNVQLLAGRLGPAQGGLKQIDLFAVKRFARQYRFECV